MDNVKNDFYYVKRLLKSIEVTSRYLEGRSMDDLNNDGYLCDAIENRSWLQGWWARQTRRHVETVVGLYHK